MKVIRQRSATNVTDQRARHITGPSHGRAATQGDSRQTLTFINWLHVNVVRAAHTRASCHLRSEPSTPFDSKDQSSDI